MKTYWYREPWAWFIFILPSIAVVASITTYVIANTNADTLVVGDYYKQGKAINFQVAKVKQAQKLGIRFALQLSNNKLIIKPTGIEKEFSLLNVDFFHPTLEERDFHLALTPDGNSFFRHTFDNDISGKWKITITSFENEWKIQDTINLPQSTFIDIIPDPTKAQ